MILKPNYIYVNINLNGERSISSLKVWRPKWETPILAENKKNSDTERIERNVNVHDMGAKILTRFHVGDIFLGYLEYQ